MKILALEFSSPQRSVAVLSTPAASPAGAAPFTDVAPNSCRSAEVIETGSSAQQPLGMIAEALRQAALEREEIERIAVGVGPGSYGGIRGAIALAQGWQLARAVKLLGISSADCLAAQAHLEGLVGRLAVVIDAQRNEFYLAEFDVQPGGWRALTPLRLAALPDVQACERAGATLLRPAVQKWFPTARLMFPRAAVLASLAFPRTDFVPGEKLEPIYLRETQFVKAPPPRVIPD